MSETTVDNNHNDQQQPAEIYDKRMTDETRVFVREFLRMAKQSDITKVDLKLVRAYRAERVRQLNSLFKFDSLAIDEFTVTNPSDGHEIKVVKYEPKEKQSADTPITVFFHGGGYTLGSTESHHITVARLAQRTRSIWLSVDYRLCPEHPYPTPYLDCKRVTEWVHENKTKFSSASAKLGVCGDSSGGQTAAIVAHELKHLLDFQILIYPCLSYGATYPSYKEFTGEQYLLTPETMKFFHKCLGPECEQYREKFAVIDYKTSSFANVPKCFLIAVDLDPLVDDSREYEKKLRANNIECSLSIIPGVVHGYFSQPVAFKDAFGKTEDLFENIFKSI